MDGELNFDRLLAVPPFGGHDDEQVDIGVFVGCAVGVGAEEDDPLGVEHRRHAVRVVLDALKRNHSVVIIPEVSVGQAAIFGRTNGGRSGIKGHEVIR